MADLDTDIDLLVRNVFRHLDPDRQDRDAMLRERLVDEHRQRMSPAPTRAFGRRHRLRLAVAAAGGIAVAALVAVAMWPVEQPADSGGSLNLAARATLLDAAHAAEQARWRAPAGGTYLHIASMPYSPELPELGQDSPFAMGAGASESWLDRTGRGHVVLVDGGSGDPERVPSTHRDPKSGKVLGIGSSRPKAGVGIEDQLRYPDSINVMAWPRDGRTPYQRAWVRTRKGFELTDEIEMTTKTMGVSQEAARFIRDAWGASIEQIDAANASPNPDDAALDLIDQARVQKRPGIDSGSDGTPTEQRIEVPESQYVREAQIEHAVNLLGSAPLSPEVRASIFRWLADQPGAHVNEQVSDSQGRRGTEIIFEDRRNREVPSYTVTARELVNPHRSGPQTIDGLDTIDLDRTYTVRDNRVERWWRMGVIIDVDRGELLQQYMVRRQRLAGDYPYFVTMADGPKILVGNPGGGAMQAGGRVILERTYTSKIDPKLEVCRDQPRVCR